MAQNLMNGSIETRNDMPTIKSQSHSQQKFNYFRKVAHQVQITSLQKIFVEMTQIGDKFQQKLQSGTISLSRKRECIQTIRELNKQIYQKKKQLNSNINELDSLSQRRSESHRQNNKRKQQKYTKDLQLQKKSNIKLIDLKKQTQMLKRKKNNLMELKKQQIERQNKIIAQTLQKEKLNKEKVQRQNIIQKIRQLNQQKMIRSQIIKKSYQKSNSIPKYVSLEKQFERKKQLSDIHKDKISKQRRQKLLKQYSPSNIKNYQDQYQFNAYQNSTHRLTTDINQADKQQLVQKLMIYGRTEDDIYTQKLKLEKRNQFSKKVLQIPIRADFDKILEAQINKDVALNPFKYNFLSQKCLTKLQIYKSFKERFQINIDQKKIGNGYLEEFKSSIKKKTNKTQPKAQQFKNPEKSQKKIYHNYLKDLKIKKKEQPKQLCQIVSNSQNKSAIVDELLGISKQKQKNMRNRINKHPLLQDYEQLTQRQAKNDEDYILSLKCKLAASKLI